MSIGLVLTTGNKVMKNFNFKVVEENITFIHETRNPELETEEVRYTVLANGAAIGSCEDERDCDQIICDFLQEVE